MDVQYTVSVSTPTPPSACISITCSLARNLSSSSCETVTSIVFSSSSSVPVSFPAPAATSQPSATVTHTTRNLLVTTTLDPILQGNAPPIDLSSTTKSNPDYGLPAVSVQQATPPEHPSNPATPEVTPVFTYSSYQLTPGEKTVLDGKKISCVSSGNAVVIDGSTSTLKHTPIPTPVFTHAGQTLTPGEVINVHGTTASFAPSDNALVIDGSTSILTLAVTSCMDCILPKLVRTRPEVGAKSWRRGVQVVAVPSWPLEQRNG